MQICRKFLEIRITKRNCWAFLTFHASERTVYKEFQNPTLSAKEDLGIGENGYFFRRRTAKVAHK